MVKKSILPFSSSTLLYFLVSLGMIIVHMIFMSNLLPWIDEVMCSDTSLHYASGDGWITHAWPTHAGREPISLVAPLYQFLLTVWMWIFGTSLWASRSLNLLITFLIGIGMFKISEHLGIKIQKTTAIILALLLWCTPAMSFMFRNGRTDLLGALFSIYLLICIIDYVKGDHGKKRPIILFSALIMLTNLTAAIFVALVLIFGFISLSGYRKPIFLAGLWTVGGLVVGFVLMALFFLSKGALLAFLENLFAFSGSLKAIAAKLFPYYGPLLGLDADYYMGKLLQENTIPTVSFADRMLELLKTPSYLILLLPCILFAGIHYKIIKQSPHKKVICGLLLLGILIPACMLLIGRFAAYYYWMALLPLILSLCLIFQQEELKFHKAIILAIVLVLTILQGALLVPDSHYREMRAFIQESSVLKDKVIASSFAPFYEIERCSNQVYYPEIMSPENLPEHFDYFIMPICKNVAEQRLIKLLEKIKSDEANEVRLIATCQNPYFELYEIKQTNIQSQ